MRWSTLHFQVRTPLFSGAGPGQQLSIPGIRGALGFWLRALLGAEIGENIPRLAQRQADVLGIGGRDARTSPVALRWASPPPVPYLSDPSTSHARHRAPRWLTRRPGLHYLLGQGLWTHRPAKADDDDPRGLQRPWLDTGTTFDVGVRLPADTASCELFLSALWLLSNYGGLGARTRRGFGQVTIHTDIAHPPDWWPQPAELDPATALPTALTGLATATPGHTTPTYPRFGLCTTGPTALSSRRPVTTHDADHTIHHSHNLLGRHWRNFRADNTSSTTPRPTRYTTEYRDVIASDTSTEFPLASLGLPVVFDQKKSTVNLHQAGQQLRLASPHWLRPDVDAHHTLTFVHTLRPAGAELLASHRPDTLLTGLAPQHIRDSHNAWARFDGESSNRR